MHVHVQHPLGAKGLTRERGRFPAGVNHEIREGDFAPDSLAKLDQ